MNLVNPNQSDESDLSESVRMIPKNSVSFELIGLIRIYRIDSNWPDSSDCKFGLILINSDWTDSFGLQVRIDFEWVSDWFGFKNFFGLDRNETVWFGYKFLNNS